MYISNAQDPRRAEAAVHQAPKDGTPANEPATGRRGRTPRRPARRRTLASVAAVCSLGGALLLAGCGQNFEQDGGVVPVPHASTEGVRTVTPGPVPSEEVIGPGYAPPLGERPTQTAVPNLPGGKL